MEEREEEREAWAMRGEDHRRRERDWEGLEVQLWLRWVEEGEAMCREDVDCAPGGRGGRHGARLPGGGVVE